MLITKNGPSVSEKGPFGAEKDSFGIEINLSDAKQGLLVQKALFTLRKHFDPFVVKVLRRGQGGKGGPKGPVLPDKGPAGI